MEQFELLKLRDIFQIEIELKNTKYPFARTTFKALFEKLKEQIMSSSQLLCKLSFYHLILLFHNINYYLKSKTFYSQIKC